MNRLKVLALAAAALAVMAVSCKKEPKKVPTQLSVTVSEVTATGATVQVTSTGEAPTMVRFLSATELSGIGFDLNDVDGIAAYVSENGSAISLPYTFQITDLEPYMDYAVGAVAFDKDLKVTTAAAASFQTAAPDNAINESGNGAGSVSDRTI